MDIYFLRHASAGQSLPNAKRDEKRPLDREGIEQCRHIGKTMAALAVKPAIIFSSPLTRCKQTAELIAKEIHYDDAIQFDDALRPEAGYQQFLALVRRYSKEQSIMVVGHNPNLSEFISLTISDGAVKTAVDLRKGAVAEVAQKRNRATLNWCITPKTARAIYDDAVTSSSRPNTSRK